MFFTSTAGDAEPPEAAAEAWVSAGLSFRGDPPGRFGVRLSVETGRKIAASFLGVDEEAVTEAQIGEVACELANMLCGSVLSRLETQTRFELNSPELNPPETTCQGDRRTAHRTLQLEEGTLTLWLELEQAR
jgi:CheY-specific phosphatase CheX